FANADLLLCDVSAVANDWLSTGRPLIITRSADRQAQDAATELLGVVPRLTQAKAEQAGQIARDLLENDTLQQERVELTEYCPCVRTGSRCQRTASATPLPGRPSSASWTPGGPCRRAGRSCGSGYRSRRTAPGASAPVPFASEDNSQLRVPPRYCGLDLYSAR